MKRFVYLFSFALMVLAFQNCSNGQGAQFVDSASLASSAVTCHPDLATTTRMTKILFLVDTSGSNVTDWKNIGSDDDKLWRLSAIKSLVNNYSMNSNIYFGLVGFQDSDAIAFIKQSRQAVFSNNVTTLQNGIIAFAQNEDDGATPYKAAFQAAQTMISRDQTINHDPSISYAIVMLTDGAPTDYSKGYNQIDDAAILQDVRDLVNLAPSQISFNTIYYYNQSNPIDSAAYQRLLSMADAGGGRTQIVNSTSNLNVDQGIQFPSLSCP